MAITSYIVTFDGNSLTNVAGLSILGLDPYRPPRRSLTQYVMARADRSRVNSAFYTAKEITVKVAIQRGTRELAENSFDALMSMLMGISKALIVPEGGSVRQYTCTLKDAVMQKSGTSYIEADLIFTTDDSFGYETGYTTVLSLSGITSNTRGDAVPFGGSAPWQPPLITVFYTAVSGGASKSVVIGNAGTGQQITVTRSWATGDRLEIDCLNRTVKVNGTDVAFTGGFPEFQGAINGATTVGNWSYQDTFTTRTFNATITHYRRYI